MSRPVHEGTLPARLATAEWRKSKHSGQIGQCVEVASLDRRHVALRNSRDPNGPALIFSRDEMAAFLAGTKNGGFDDLAG